MAGLSPNSANIERVGRGVANATGVIVHPEYQYWRPEWTKLRDCIAGQREIKRKAETYLQAMKGADVEDYRIYLERATFYNMTAQTLNGMVGQVFRRDPIIRDLPGEIKAIPALDGQVGRPGAPSPFKDAVRKFAKDGTGHANFAKTVMSEQIGLGRFGVLVDAPATPQKTPTSFAVGYPAENILDWTIEEVDGFYVPTRILLREFERQSPRGPDRQNPWIGDRNPTAAKVDARRRALRQPDTRPAQMVRSQLRSFDRSGYIYETVFRELVLEYQPDGTFAGQRIYCQYVYENDPTTMPRDRFVPTVRGQPLDFIPFKFFGATSNTCDVEKSPLLDIADLNLSHYRTYAELEYGRLFTALPVYYAPGKDDDGAAEYHIGPNIVWEVPQGSEPGILEYTGQGLKALETALSDKERQIAAIGGRLMPGSSKSVSESNNQTVLREANEQALLLSVVLALECGMADVVRWWLMWRDVPLSQTASLRYEVNTDFLSTPIGAREIRAIQMMYQDGLIGVPTLYNYLRKAEIIPSEMTLSEFQAELADPDSFINNPDVQARQRGFSSRTQELDQARVAREADFQQQQIDIQDRAVTVDEEKQRIAAEAGSTSITGQRKLGDPEQAAPAIVDKAAIKVAAKTAATAAKVAAKPTPSPLPAAGSPAGRGTPQPPVKKPKPGAQ